MHRLQIDQWYRVQIYRRYRCRYFGDIDAGAEGVDIDADTNGVDIDADTKGLISMQIPKGLISMLQVRVGAEGISLTKNLEWVSLAAVIGTVLCSYCDPYVLSHIVLLRRVRDVLYRALSASY
jgi:hypothetical protein